jgi:two-component system, sensor histidine kinase and response regulator
MPELQLNDLAQTPAAAVSALPATAQTPPAQRRRGTLLIVDDEEGPRDSLRIIFKDEYDLLLAADGPQAIDLAQKNRVDVALLDVRMAGMSGIEVLERLKYVDPGIEVVMMTAFETTDTLRQAMRLRACDYINKPFDLGTIRAAVAGAMHRRTLEGEVADSTEKLQDLLSELQDQKVEEQMAHTRGEIYASIIHDINGPLTVISGFVQLINQRIASAERLEREELDFLRDRMRTITRQVTNCIEISRRYLSFLRRQSEDTPRVGINQLLVDLEHLVRVHPSRMNHDFKVHALPADIAVRINGTDVLQILLNLAVNAFQCTTQQHAVEIHARVSEEPLDLAAMKDGPADRLLNIENFSNHPPLVVLSVRDSGPGIPAEVLPRIFQPYFTTKAGRQGTGLGLNIVQRLIKEAKGALHVHTEEGRGTTFSVFLPAVHLPSN